MATRTQVGIVGAGPAGLLLGRMLHLAGIESVILERRSREYCEHRLRAGMLEHYTAELLSDVGLDERLKRQAFVHEGFELRFGGERHRIPMADLTGGCKAVMYAQTEIVKDAIAGCDGFHGVSQALDPGRLQRAQLHELVTSEAAMTAFCHNYVGLPFAGRVHHSVRAREPGG